jgi:hypothetical protein
VDVAGKSGTLTVFFFYNPKMQAILFDREDLGVGVNQNWEVTRVVKKYQILEENFLIFF